MNLAPSSFTKEQVVYIRPFNLAEFGINQDEFISFLAPTFYDLEEDAYDVRLRQIGFLAQRFPERFKRKNKLISRYYQRGYVAKSGLIESAMRELSDDDQEDFYAIKSYRQRSVATLTISHSALNDQGYQIALMPPAPFVQGLKLGGHYYHVSRDFEQTPPEIIFHPLMVRFITSIARLVATCVRHVKLLRINLHNISVIAKKGSFGEPVPEGMHQDGADYIVSALVIERSNLAPKSGESIIYGLDKKTEYFRRVLQPGKGIFQDDRCYFHDATPVFLDDESNADIGRRSILGLDINYKHR